MKKIIMAGVMLLVFGASWGMAQQSSEKKDRSGMHGMMPDMMKESKPGEGSHGMMQDMHGMMGMMMKMMDQCSAMMKSAQAESGAKESQKK